MAHFVVTSWDGKRFSYLGERCRYFIKGDHLTVLDGQGRRLQYSPAGWLCVVDVEPGESPEGVQLT